MESTIAVDGMACEGCEETVVDALTALEGVSTATADHGDDAVRVEHDGVDGEALAAAIEDAGYEVVD